MNSNPLRILDSKSKQDQKIIKNAPSISDYLTPSDKDNFDIIKNGLSDLNIPFKVNSNLVRGLDYYNGMTFEITSNICIQIS